MAITITPEALAQSAQKYRKELLMVITIALQASLEHMTLRPGVPYKESVGMLRGNAQFGPYDPSRKNTANEIIGRDLEVYLGSVIKEFDPNNVLKSIYGSLILSGKKLTDTEITKAIIAAELKSLSTKLNSALFDAVRNASGTTSKDLFNGFDTIAAAEITAEKITTGIGNRFNFTEAITSSNAYDSLKLMYRAAKDELREETVKMLLPWDIYDAYCDDYQATVGAAPYNKEFKKTFLEGSNNLCELVPLSSKKGSKYIQLTSKKNMLVGTGSGQDMETLNVDRFSAFQVTLSSAILFGAQYESIQPEHLLIGKLYEAPEGE